jgi:hypothetical protein
MTCIRFLVIACFVGFSGCATLVSDNNALHNSFRIDAKPIIAFDRDDSQRRIFGSLEFRGGLELSSDDPRFGGFSALRFQADGEHFLALSDRAYWLRGRIVYDGNRPAGLADTEMAPVIGPDGKHASHWDTESIAVNGNRLYIGIEDLDRIPCFLYDDGKFPVFLNTIPFPPGANAFPRNKGLEALEFVPKIISPGGALVAFSEEGLDKDGNLRAYIIEGAKYRSFAVRRSDDLDISDAALLPDGDILILERKYEIVNGVTIRLRRIPVVEIRPGEVVDGSVVFKAGMRYEIDNMEAMSAYRDEEGVTVLTLMSDDNYSAVQRTLLLQFVYRK